MTPIVAATAFAAAALATPAAAQQSGRMQVTATVVDVSSSLEVVKTLRNRLGQQASAGMRHAHTRPWVLSTESRKPAPAAAKPRQPERTVTIFYY